MRKLPKTISFTRSTRHALTRRCNVLNSWLQVDELRERPRLGVVQLGVPLSLVGFTR